MLNSGPTNSVDIVMDIFSILNRIFHYNDVIVTAMASQITSLTSVYLIIFSGTYDRKHQSSASLAFVRGIHRWPVNSPHKEPVTRKMFPFDDVIMLWFFDSDFHFLISLVITKFSDFLKHPKKTSIFGDSVAMGDLVKCLSATILLF